MSKFRADYNVKCSLVLPDDAPCVITSDDPPVQITLRNAPLNANGHVPELIAEVVGDCASIDEVARRFRELLSDQLDVMSFATHAIFFIDQCLRVVEWEEFQRRRRILPMQKFDPLSPPAPDLQKVLLETVQAIIQLQPKRYVIRAMHLFRLGVIEKDPADQYLRFWSVLETIAEVTKETERLAIQCPKCRADLFCEKCNETPTRRPMASQAIRELLMKINTEGERLFRMLSDTRNHLIHGGSVESLEQKIGIPLANAINEAAGAAWHAILSCMPELPGSQYHFGHRAGDFVHRDLVVSADMLIEHVGNEPHPAEDKIPKVQISIQTAFRPLQDAEHPIEPFQR